MSGSAAISTLHVRFFEPETALSRSDLARVEKAVRNVPGLVRALAFMPIATSSHQPFAADGRGPALALQLDFSGEVELDAAARACGPLAALVTHGFLPMVGRARVDAQRFVGRKFPTPDPVFRLPPGGAPCTFLVDYPGTTANLEAWLDYYDAHHPPIMIRFPGVREVVTFRPALGARNDLPCEFANSMQRNKVVFDSAAALEAALVSPVMAQMRADSAAFPAFTHRATHFAMASFDMLAS